MWERFKLYRQFRKEVDRDALAREAIAWTKAYFKKRGIPTWTSEYQNTFGVHVTKYMSAYIHAYAKRRLAEHRNKQLSEVLQ
jgi:hypothetical protein